jgi:CheY-like chemotaxis protein
MGTTVADPALQRLPGMIEILVVDDDALMRGLLAEWLRAAGYGVREAEHGGAALQMLRKRPANLLITDMDMPGRDGAQTMDEARRVVPGLPVIAISGGTHEGQESWMATARNLGAARTLVKPFGREALLAAVEDIVPKDRSRAIQT